MKDRTIAYILLRTTLGIDFLGHGSARLLRGNAAFAQGMVKQMADTPFPPSFVLVFGTVLPTIELTLGLLLIAGLFTRSALLAGASLMMALMLGVTLRQDWATAGLQLLYALVFSLLLFFREDFDASWPSLIRRRPPA